MKYNFFNENEFTRLDSTLDLYTMLQRFMRENGINSVSVVSNEHITKELLYIALNDDCNFNSINLDHYNYDDAYIVTLECMDDTFEIIVEKAKYKDSKYLATDNVTFIQYDIPCRRKYVEDIRNNKYIDSFDPKFFMIDGIDEDNKTYTYTNHFKDENHDRDIFVESTSKDFVEMIKKIFE